MELELKETANIDVLHTSDNHTLFKYKNGPYEGMVISFMDVALKIHDSKTDEEITDHDLTELDTELHYLGISFRFNTVDNPNNIDTDDPAYRKASGDAMTEVLHQALACND